MTLRMASLAGSSFQACQGECHSPGFLTFLEQHVVGGLQIRKQEGTWFDAPVLPGKFLVNNGDIFRRWTIDRYLSTPHRVSPKSGGQGIFHHVRMVSLRN